MRAWILAIAVAGVVPLSGPAFADELAEAASSGPTRVAILPLTVNSVGEQGYLRSGLADMLASRLARNPGVSIVRVDAESQATTDPRRAAAIGVELGARYVVFGSFTQFGQGASLDVQCVEARAYEKKEDPGARRIFIQSGTVGEIIPKLDATAQKIGLFVAGPAPEAAPAVGAAPAPEPSASDAEIESLRRRVEALEAYLFGEATDGDVEGATP